jgi:hypothetical protein
VSAKKREGSIGLAFFVSSDNIVVMAGTGYLQLRRHQNHSIFHFQRVLIYERQGKEKA